MKGHIWVVLTAFVLVCACNKEDYYGTTLAIEGADAACSAGTDQVSCEAISGCQAAFEDVESVTPVFASCIANPPAPGDVVVTPPVVNPPVIVPPATLPPVVVKKHPSKEDDEDDDDEEEDKDDEETTVKKACDDKCKNIEAKYLLVKNYSGEGQGRRVEKVKVCHHTGNGSSHAIIVACPALKAHVNHDDELGACASPNP